MIDLTEEIDIILQNFWLHFTQYLDRNNNAKGGVLNLSTLTL